MKVEGRFFLVIVTAMLTACTAPLTKQDLVSIKTIEIVNNFPDKPNFTNVGTTMFNNKYELVDDPSYKLFITNEIKSQLQKRGYIVIEASDSTAPSKPDLILEVIPRDIYDMIDTYGYGFYDRSVFNKSKYRKSYFALNLRPVTNGKSRCDVCYGESLTDLPLEDMPDAWGSLSDNKKEEFKAILLKDIKKTIEIVLPKTGL